MARKLAPSDTLREGQMCWPAKIEAAIRAVGARLPPIAEDDYDPRTLAHMAHEQGVADVRYIRCLEHRNVPQINHSEMSGGECGECARLASTPEPSEPVAWREEWQGANGEFEVFYVGHHPATLGEERDDFVCVGAVPLYEHFTTTVVSNPEETPAVPDAVEQLAAEIHEVYEWAAVAAGWETQTRSRCPWQNVPPENQEATRAVARYILAKTRDAK